MNDVTGQTDVPLRTRSNTANSWGADFCVSIHHNAGINGGSGGGVVSIVYLKVGATTKKLQSEIYNNVIVQTGLKGNRAEPLTSMDLHICRETKMPAVLVECCFMDSKTDVPIILTDDFARKCALGIAKGLNYAAFVFQIHQSSITPSNYSILEIIWRTKMDIKLQKINDEISYFNVVVKNMNLKDRIKLSKIKEHEVTLESEVYENMPDNFDLDEKISDDNLTGWIDLIENEKLHKAVKSLSVEDQIFISYIVKERWTQRELEKIYNIDHKNIGRRFKKITEKIKLIYEKGKS